MFKSIPVAQFGLDIMCNLCIVIYYQDIEIAVGLRSFTGGFGSFCAILLQDLLWLEVFLAQWNVYLEAGTFDSIGAVVCLDLASVHLYECLAEVQSYAGAFDVKVAAVVALVEPVKESVGLLFLQSDAGILYLDDGILLVLAHDECDGAAIESILHGVGEQVGNHLVEVDAVYPYRQLAIGIVEARIFLERECDVALFCIETVERYDAVQEFPELGFLTVQMHLVFVYLSLVEYLVYQKQQALGVAVDGVDFLFAFGIRDSCLQLVERSHNQCQR